MQSTYRPYGFIGILILLLGVGVLLPLSTYAQTDEPIDPNIPPTVRYASPTPSVCIPPRDFKLGDTVVLTSGISIRSAPNPDSALLVSFQEFREFLIVGGAVCVGGFNFWQIDGHGLTGWVAEGRTEWQRDGTYGTRYWLRLVRRADDSVIKCETPMRLTHGEKFDILYNVRIRAEPSLTAITRTIVPAESSVTVLDGVTCAEGYNWWKVRAVVLGVTYEGWMAEASRFGDPFVEMPAEGDGTICDFPLRLKIGDRARVTYNDGVPKNLRSAPNTSAPLLYELVKGVPLEIIGGPICANSYNWWQVRILASNDVVGWMAEGGPAQYWIARNSYTLP